MAEEKHEPLNLDSYLEKKLRNRVVLSGVELEGGWKQGQMPPGITSPVRDASVFKHLGDEGGVVRTNKPGYYFGEIPIGPYQVGYLPRAMKRYWPLLIDDTCGMHVHMSFETAYQYGLIMDSSAYQDTIQEYLIRWAKEENIPADHCFWERIKGNNEYCQKKFWPLSQMQQSEKDYDHHRFGHRYTMVHYCWQRKKTVEVRVLPMFEDFDLSVRAVKRVIQITNAYLLATNKSRPKAGHKVRLESGDVYEEHIEIIV